MKKLMFTSIVFMFVFLLVGCSIFDGPTETQEGYIVEVDNRILVVSNITKEEALNMDEESLLSSSDNFGNAVWYSVADIEPFEVGQFVRVEYREMAESYPGQSTAVSVRILEE